MRIAVTGANGFIGAAISREAVRRGWEVFGYGRRPPARQWDITTGPLLRAPRVDAVVHAAAAVSDWGPAGPIRAATVEGTVAVAASFPGARFVHISSASIYNPFSPTVYAPESAGPVHRYLNAYGRAKADAERVLAVRANTVILRPNAVYGPGDTTLMPRILGSIKGNSLFIVGDGSALHSLTHIDGLVEAALSGCLPDAPPGTYNIADAEPVRVGTALTELTSARGLDLRIRYLPLRMSWVAAGALEISRRAIGNPRPPRLTRYAISHLAVERTLDITMARVRLGFDPRPTDFTGAKDW